MKYTLTFFAIFMMLWSAYTQTSHIKPGFSKSEYIELLQISARQGDKAIQDSVIAFPKRFARVYRSPVVGLDNRWDLWVSGDSLAVISIRGTTMKTNSWLENFYCGMVPAKGSLQLSKEFKFDYELGEHPKAAVHLGWLIGTAYLAQDIIPQINKYQKKGIQDFLIIGHSQGGAIAYLLTSYLFNLKQNGNIDPNIAFKTYCSAAPKPGNLFYAYDFEKQTQGGWAYTVFNIDDWVPQTPFSIQTSQDYSENSPFDFMDDTFKKSKGVKGLMLKYAYNHLDRSTKKSNKKFQKYLLEFEMPEFYNSNNYQRAGIPVVLYGDKKYHDLFPNIDKVFWTHHMIVPYIYLSNLLAD